MTKERKRTACDHQPAPTESCCGRLYEICLGARLDEGWADWFEGLDMKACGESCSMLFGRVADQAALLGILNKLCRLNIPLVSLNQVDQEKRWPKGCRGKSR
jgi:hypothetical protein